MWKITVEYRKAVGSQFSSRCVIVCPENHPYDVLKQTVSKYPTKRCKACNAVYTLPTLSRELSQTPRAIAYRKNHILEVSDCWDMSYREIAERLGITQAEAQKSCDSAMKKLLLAVADDSELFESYKEYLRETPFK